MFPADLEAAAADVMVRGVRGDPGRRAGAGRRAAGGRCRGSAGLRVLVYPDADKIGKQIKYAESLGVRVAALVGDDETHGRHRDDLKHLKPGPDHRSPRRRTGRDRGGSWPRSK